MRARALDTTPQSLGTLRPGLGTPPWLEWPLCSQRPGVSCAACLLHPGPCPHRCFLQVGVPASPGQAAAPGRVNVTNLAPPARPRMVPVGKHLCELAGPHLQLCGWFHPHGPREKLGVGGTLRILPEGEEQEGPKSKWLAPRSCRFTFMHGFSTLVSTYCARAVLGAGDIWISEADRAPCSWSRWKKQTLNRRIPHGV